jgi:hypothetical protein
LLALVVAAGETALLKYPSDSGFVRVEIPDRFADAGAVGWGCAAED